MSRLKIAPLPETGNGALLPLLGGWHPRSEPVCLRADLTWIR